MYALMGNTGQTPGTAAVAPPLLLPAGMGSGGERPLEGRTAGICWKVRCARLRQAGVWRLRGSPQQAPAAVVALLPATHTLLPPLQWFDDASPAVAHACNAAVSLLEAAGLRVEEVALPELALLRTAHSCTITSEMRNSMSGGWWVGMPGQVCIVYRVMLHANAL